MKIRYQRKYCWLLLGFVSMDYYGAEVEYGCRE